MNEKAKQKFKFGGIVPGSKKISMFSPLLPGERIKAKMNEKITINLKPLSVNDAWCGQRFKTPEYKNYEVTVLAMLPRDIDIPETGKLEIFLEFGVSSKGFDWDNAIKPFVDVLQRKYQFNDNRIYQALLKKTIVKKGDEFIKFKIENLYDGTSK